jgi:hypothetical protein
MKLTNAELPDKISTYLDTGLRRRQGPTGDAGRTNLAVRNATVVLQKWGG